MSDKIKTLIITMGASFSALYGGWGLSEGVLLSFMTIDYITGIVVSTVFKNSPKTDTGTLSSNVGFKGLIKKISILVMVFIAHQLDMLLGVNYIKNTATIGFIANELYSIVENYGLMNFKIPKIIRDCIDILNKKGETND